LFRSKTINNNDKKTTTTNNSNDEFRYKKKIQYYNPQQRKGPRKAQEEREREREKAWRENASHPAAAGDNYLENSSIRPARSKLTVSFLSANSRRAKLPTYLHHFHPRPL